MTSAPTHGARLDAADALYERALAALPGGNSRTTVFVPPRPPYAVRGSGCRLTDADGREVIDLQNNYTALVHGHAHPRLVEAATEAVREGAAFGLPTEWEIELAEALAARVPAAPLWRFANSGTEAVMVAIRLARAVTGRPAILRFEGCYHGSADAVVSTGPGVPDGVARDVVVVPVGDREALDAALAELGDRLAAVLFDAMPNRAGLRPAAREFVTHLRAETRRRGVLLIQDEVLTYRIWTGGMHSLYGIDPDVVTLGKVIGGGFPVGAVGGRAEVMEHFDPRRARALSHGGTFSANPVTMRAGLAALELLTAEEIGRLNALGDRLRFELGLQGWEVTGMGSLLRVHADDVAELWWRLYENGVLIAGNGLMCLSTPMDGGVLDEVTAAFGRVRRG